MQRELSPLDGIKNRVGNKAEVVYARGYVGDARGEYNGVVTGQNLQDDRTPEELIAEAVKVAADADYVIFIGGLNKSNNQDCEDTDRAGLELPYGQDAVISALAKANKNLVVINVSGNAVAMPWIAEVPSVLQAWFLGSEAGRYEIQRRHLCGVSLGGQAEEGETIVPLRTRAVLHNVCLWQTCG